MDEVWRLVIYRKIQKLQQSILILFRKTFIPHIIFPKNRNRIFAENTHSKFIVSEYSFDDITKSINKNLIIIEFTYDLSADSKMSKYKNLYMGNLNKPFIFIYTYLTMATTTDYSR